jgi:YidC/Oxa1 family membrane protein insertase
VWDVILDAIFLLLNWLFEFSQDWGMAIILITIIFRVVIYPITHKQMKTNHVMQKLQPRIKELQEKYADDQPRMQQEMMKLYQEAKFNPLSGCLPMLLQMPIFMALYGVLMNLTARIESTGVAVDATQISFYGIIPDLTLSPSTVFAEQGIGPAIPYIILMLLFGVSMLLPVLTSKENRANRQMLIMMGVMSVMMLWFGWTVPAGVVLYWDMSSLLGVAQQMISKEVYKRQDAKKAEETIDITPVKVDVDRKEKKARPRKSGK